MRAIAIHVVLVAVYGLHLLCGVEAVHSSIVHYNNGVYPNVTAYSEFIAALRARLASGSDAHGMPVLPRVEDVSTEDRFVLVQLKNCAGDSVVVLIDAVNVYVAGYLVGNTVNYISNTTPPEAHDILFPRPHFQHKSLCYRINNYGQENEKLGHAALNRAIDALFYGYSQRSALSVITQMVSEAAKIRYIEYLVRRSMTVPASSFVLDYKALSLEDKWYNLSQQVQWSGSSGVFTRPIQIRDLWNNIVQIDNTQGVLRGAALALLAYQCRIKEDTTTTTTTAGSSILIRMPVHPEKEWCPVTEPTASIIGREEMCVDVKSDTDKDGTPVVLWPCGYGKRNQFWTFKTDGTIRSMGKCLATNMSSSSIMIYDCGLVKYEAVQWALTDAGTIINPRSGRVLTASSPTQETILTLATDSNSATQAWKAGNYTQPIVSYVSGFQELCLQANEDNTRVWLARCAISDAHREAKQEWALYSDSTIRLYSDRSLCVTSNGHSINNVIVLRKCQGQGNQRWTFTADGTILNPNAKLVMEVKESDVSLQQIVLHQPTGNPNQKWLAF